MGKGASLAAMRVPEQVPPSWPQISFIQDLATTSFPCAFRSRSLYRAASPAQRSALSDPNYRRRVYAQQRTLAWAPLQSKLASIVFKAYTRLVKLSSAWKVGEICVHLHLAPPEKLQA